MRDAPDDAGATPVERALAADKRVAASAPYAQGVVMLEYQRRPAFPAIQGYDLARVKQVIPLEERGRERRVHSEVDRAAGDGMRRDRGAHRL